ncbi:hypothetical protein [uncultured Demequina sp.]|uniref:variant leucine-rich repeat-containing protein n=1 Tax=uncultured Demequina sp. TaxID=693499 RepID=UPI0025DF1455|nr:hypothetical protein [uncultured Demequina sp.]
MAMHWSAEEFALVITGLLFLAAVASSFLPRVELTWVQRAALAIGAAAALGSAALSARSGDAHLPALVWAVPVLAVAVVVVTRVRARARNAARATRASASGTEAIPTSTVLRTSVLAPETVDSAARRVLLARAADPASSAQELSQIASRHEHLRVVVAANPSTPASTLEWLASHGDARIRDAIAQRGSRRRAAAAVPAL